MKVVYLIGNGFDLNLGLKTSYSDFYTYYLNVKNNDAQIINLKRHLQNDKNKDGKYKYWSDLEIAMGEYTQEFSNKDDMEKVYNDLYDNLRDYIKNVELSGVQNDYEKNKLQTDLARPEKYLRKVFIEEIRTYAKKWKFQSSETYIISFNYTKTIETIFNYKFNMNLGPSSYNNMNNILFPIIHIHGTSNDPIIGLNDISQIGNKQLKNDIEVQDFLLKPKINEAVGHLNDKQALNHISQANLICLFGVSLGETDNLWWNAVGERLKSDCRVIYFVYNPEEHPRPSELTKIRRKYKDFLLSRTKLSLEEKQEVFNKIYIVHNSNMFNLKKSKL